MAVFLVSISVQSFRITCPRNNIRMMKYKHNILTPTRYIQQLHANEDDKEKDDSKDNNNKQSRPPIIPFDFDATDFMREDFRLQQQKRQQEMEAENVKQAQVQAQQLQPVTIRSPPSTRTSNSKSNSNSNSQSNIGSYDNSDYDRPTGYDNAEEDPNDLDQTPTQEQLDQYEEQFSQIRKSRNPIIQVLFNAYVGTPYDSKNKREARFVTRSITLISFLIGVVFTGVFYAFPSKFLSIRGNTDFTARYTSEQQRYDPDQLLQDAIEDNFVPFDMNLERSKVLRENSIERFGDPPRDLDKENFAKPTMTL